MNRNFVDFHIKYFKRSGFVILVTSAFIFSTSLIFQLYERKSNLSDQAQSLAKSLRGPLLSGSDAEVYEFCRSISSGNMYDLVEVKKSDRTLCSFKKSGFFVHTIKSTYPVSFDPFSANASQVAIAYVTVGSEAQSVILSILLLPFLFLVTIFTLNRLNRSYRQSIEKDLARPLGNLSNIIKTDPRNIRETKDLISDQTFSEISELINSYSNLIGKLDETEKELILISQQEALFKISRQVAHDIRSPISALKSSLPILSKDPTTASELLKMSIDRIDSIANDLLDRSRSKLSAVDLEQSVRRIVAEKISDPDISSQIKFSIDVQSDLPKVYAERAMIERMVSNLFNNSIEAMSSKGEINIKISRLGSDELQLTITDSGPGTSDEIITLLNQSPTSLGKKAGNGIGLIQAKTYIASVGGRILFSSSLGHGFTVEIIFPVWNDPA